MAENIFDTLLEIEEVKARIKQIINGNGGLLSNETIDLYDTELKRLFNIQERLFLVEFYDYDGTLLKSEQVLKGNSATAPTVMPDHSDIELQFIEWNCTFDDVQMDMVIGACYRTIDDATHIHISIPTDGETLEFRYYSVPTNAIFIVFGDGSEAVTAVRTMSHTFVNAGDYVIKTGYKSTYVGTKSKYSLGDYTEASGIPNRILFINKPEYITHLLIDQYVDGYHADHSSSYYTTAFGNLVLSKVMLHYQRTYLDTLFCKNTINFLVFPKSLTQPGRLSIGQLNDISIPNISGTFRLWATDGDQLVAQMKRLCSNNTILTFIYTSYPSNTNFRFYAIEKIHAKELNCSLRMYNYSNKPLDVIANKISVKYDSGSGNTIETQMFRYATIKSFDKIERVTYQFNRRIDLKTNEWPNITSIVAGPYTFLLEELTLPPDIRSINITTAADSLVYYDLATSIIHVPASVTYIGNYAFYRPSPSAIMTFKDHTSIPTLTHMNGVSIAYRIYVPDNLLVAWKAATNWSTHASKIYPMSEYYD